MALPFPVIVFQTNLTPPTSEAFGPNSTLQGTNSPDNIVDTPNQTYLDDLKEQRKNDRSTSMPSVGKYANYAWGPPEPNKVKNGEIFVVAGQAAINTMKLYCNKAKILENLPAYTGEGAAPGFDILTVLYFGPDPGI
ncbi:MAG: hypothetical protein M0R80_00775 [Proteobacteria bacterium]|jgi:hypothetical protein|nr:hypothetical protein [Pseudomonadota bacterium]